MFASMTRPDGLDSTEGVKRSQSVVLGFSWQIWFSLRSGLSVVDSSRITDYSVPALPHIEAITADNNPRKPRWLRSNSSNLPGRITFEYTGLSLAVPGRIRFSIFSRKFSTIAGASQLQREKPFTRTLRPAPIDFG